MVRIGQLYSLAFRRLMNRRQNPKEELGNPTEAALSKGWPPMGGGGPVGWPPFHFALVDEDEIGAAEGAIVACRLVSHRSMRRDLAIGATSAA